MSFSNFIGSLSGIQLQGYARTGSLNVTNIGIKNSAMVIPRLILTAFTSTQILFSFSGRIWYVTHYHDLIVLHMIFQTYVIRSSGIKAFI